MNIKNIKSIIMACLAGLLLAACSEQTTNTASQETPPPTPTPEKKILTVGVNAQFAPFEMPKDNNVRELTGFDIDLIEAMAAVNHLDIQIQHYSWENLIPSLGKDSDILISALTINNDRRKIMDFTKPYFQNYPVIMTTTSSGINSYDHLKDKRIGLIKEQTGNINTIELTSLSDKTVISQYDTLNELVNALKNNEVDAVITDIAPVQYFLKQNPENDFVLIESDRFTKESYGIAVKKGNIQLLATLNNALTKVQQSGEYDAIYNKYFGENTNTLEKSASQPENAVSVGN
ncbi:MAG: transporter substrate-binding domain-containing protein [Neisseriaceae bacterium]|nr:transporter substrate-binding domain-containing protein [Neisseriaceae bacterium]